LRNLEFAIEEVSDPFSEPSVQRKAIAFNSLVALKGILLSTTSVFDPVFPARIFGPA
jgi:hypothetical protein